MNRVLNWVSMDVSTMINIGKAAVRAALFILISMGK